MTKPIFLKMLQGDYDLLREALQAAGLPTDDLHELGRTFFSLSDGNGPIGYVGLEGGGSDRLLRSLVVLPDRRSLGFGRLLVTRLEETISGEARRLHLLTTDAAPFFRLLGYRNAARTRAPAMIAHTAEFTSLCPATAEYLMKELIYGKG